MRQKLTDTKIKNTKPQAKLIKLSDGGSLFLHVQPNGTKRFVMAYRFEGKQRSLAIGVYPNVSLSEAREVRNKAKELLAKGIDPSKAKKKEGAARQGHEQAAFVEQAKKWFEFYKTDKSEITANRNWRLLELYVFPKVGEKSIFELTRLELVEIIEEISRLQIYETAKKTARIISMVLDNAVNRGVIDYSVAQRLASVVPAYKTKNRPAILDPAELSLLLKSIESDVSASDSVHYALLLLPYVFVRNSELRCARWDEFDLETGEWLIPAERMKMKNAHFVPLARQVVGILHELQSKKLSEILLFPSPHNRSRPISDNAMRVALLRYGYSASEVSVHGFRSTASTLLHEQGFDTNVIERQLAHKDRNAIRAAYNYAEYRAERVTMMQCWADYLDGLKNG